ncbi:MAG: carboxymuconolactone decarboxylase family protein [Deltaproteobacteria bacterium]|nr:carboxymuconolactone decarboxylase family protein [Deltaproteobacteria bacterium]
MRLDKPRLAPLPDAEIDPETRERFGSGPLLNIFRTLAHHPKLMKRWLVFGNHVLARSTLAPRERELAILRIGWLCRSGYEWGQHAVIARQSGVSEAEIERVADGPGAPGWSDADRTLLRAVDELRADAFVSDPTWAALGNHFSTQQVLDLVFAVGQYQLVSMALNTLGVQPDSPELPTLPVR